MSNRQQAIEKIARFLVANEDMSARRVAAEIVTLYEQTVGLRPEISSVISCRGINKAERWVTQWEETSED